MVELRFCLWCSLTGSSREYEGLDISHMHSYRRAAYYTSSMPNSDCRIVISHNFGSRLSVLAMDIHRPTRLLQQKGGLKFREKSLLARETVSPAVSGQLVYAPYSFMFAWGCAEASASTAHSGAVSFHTASCKQEPPKPRTALPGPASLTAACSETSSRHGLSIVS